MHPKLQAKIAQLSTSKSEEDKIARSQHETVWRFSDGGDRKVLMNVKQEQ
jgi:hypothetical protein